MTRAVQVYGASYQVLKAGRNACMVPHPSGLCSGQMFVRKAC